jgi:hypothetical protein
MAVEEKNAATTKPVKFTCAYVICTYRGARLQLDNQAGVAGDHGDSINRFFTYFSLSS